jgi:hypothetical protein
MPPPTVREAPLMSQHYFHHGSPKAAPCGLHEAISATEQAVRGLRHTRLQLLGAIQITRLSEDASQSKFQAERVTITGASQPPSRLQRPFYQFSGLFQLPHCK